MKTCTINVALAVATCLGCNHKPATSNSTAPLTAVSHTDETPACGCANDEDDHAPSCCAADVTDLKEPSVVSNLDIPDTELIDQKGKKVRFYTDLVQDKVVAISFFFTRCPTICPPLTANFAALQQKMIDDGYGDDFQMISISIDPVNDTPLRLAEWSEKFGAKPGWTFLTGEKRTVDSLLKSLQVFTPLKEDHAPIVLIGSDKQAKWTRVNGLGSMPELAKVLTQAIDGAAQAQATDAPAPTGNEAAHKYFSDVELINQHGEPMRFYTDLMKDKTVIINCFFTECVGVCPVINGNLQAIQQSLGDRIGQDVHIISITVDPLKDTPQRLQSYADKYDAKPGWHFLTGSKQQVDAALGKLGFAVKHRESHSPVILVGNDRTGLWKKTLGLSKSEELIPIIHEVVND